MAALKLSSFHLPPVGVGDDLVIDVDAGQEDRAPAAPTVHRCLVHALLEGHLLQRGV
jgi:hypothetical protein